MSDFGLEYMPFPSPIPISSLHSLKWSTDTKISCGTFSEGWYYSEGLYYISIHRQAFRKHIIILLQSHVMRESGAEFECLFRLNYRPGSLNFISISCRVATFSSCGAWITITVDPNILNMQPIFPWMFNCSFKKYEDNIALWEQGKKNHSYSIIFGFHSSSVVRLWCEPVCISVNCLEYATGHWKPHLACLLYLCVCEVFYILLNLYLEKFLPFVKL